MYRPEGWEQQKIHMLIGMVGCKVDFIDAGADLMLKALRSSGLRLSEDDWNHHVIVPEQKANGTLVFIPDDG